MRRRDALVIGGAVTVALAIPPILRRLPSDFEFKPIRGFPGFRYVRGGSVSGANVALIGLEDASASRTLEPYLPPNPCSALFGPDGWGHDRVPVAVFSDFNCPYCKGLDERLVQLRDKGAPVRLIWHEMPLLGPGSIRSARAVIAAGYLGAEEAARRYLWQRNLRPGPVALRDMARSLGIGAEDLVSEVSSARVSEKLALGLALGRRLGIPGTPGTLVGRTLIIGAIRLPDLSRLIRMELEAGPLDCA